MKVVRAVVFCVAATMLVVLTLARSAHAAPAPFCDDRGATGLAAPPALEAPDEAIQRARLTGCDHEPGVDVLMASLGPWRGRVVVTANDPGPVDLTAAAIVPADELSTLMPAESQGRPCVGARGRVERPPRA